MMRKRAKIGATEYNKMLCEEIEEVEYNKIKWNEIGDAEYKKALEAEKFMYDNSGFVFKVQSHLNKAVKAYAKYIMAKQGKYFGDNYSVGALAFQLQKMRYDVDDLQAIDLEVQSWSTSRRTLLGKVELKRIETVKNICLKLKKYGDEAEEI